MAEVRPIADAPEWGSYMSRVRQWELAGLLVVAVAGAALHFVYHWTGKAIVVSAFVPVNESTWEHLKLLFMPYLAYSGIEYLAVGKRIGGFWHAKAAGVILGMAAIVMAFYTYTGIVGRNYLWCDIGIFILGVLVAFQESARRLHRHADRVWQERAGILCLIFFFLAFVLFTFFPPHIGLFLDPVTGGYGL